MSGIWEKIKERLGFGKRAEGDKEDDRVMYIIAGLGLSLIHISEREPL